MRPRKRILLVDDDELRVSEQRFLLTTRGYTVVSCGAGDALAAMRRQLVDVVIVECDRKDKALFDLVAQIKRLYWEPPVILRSSVLKPGEVAHAADVLLGPGHTPMDLMERLLVLAARRRGPRRVLPASVDAVCA